MPKGGSLLHADSQAETLKQLISGIIDAQSFAVEKGAIINPTVSGVERAVHWDRDTGRLFRDVDFDVALSAQEGTQTKGGIGVFVGALGIGSSGQSEASNQTLSRIKFSIPIVLPVQKG